MFIFTIIINKHTEVQVNVGNKTELLEINTNVYS